MPAEARPAARVHAAAPAAVPRPDGRDGEADAGTSGGLRPLGALAHQLRATTRAADDFLARPGAGEHGTAVWLMSTAVEQSLALAQELDSLARLWKDGLADTQGPQALQAVQALRVRAHQLHATARAADHYLEQDAHEAQDTGGWLVASARGLAQQLAGAIDDATGRLKPTAAPQVVDAHEATVLRRVAQASQTAQPQGGAA